MLDHMSSSGVMHGDGRWRGEEMVKHEVTKKNIAAVHAQYRNICLVLGRNSRADSVNKGLEGGFVFVFPMNMTTFCAMGN